jgi:uncharacterized protein (DUF3084 family)
MFALQTLIILLVLGGAVAFIGDRIGHRIGKKRLSFLGLRPRYTAIAITVLSGALISVFTGLILFSISSDVRIALFGLDRLKTDIRDKTKELDNIKKDKGSLQKELLVMLDQLNNSKKEIAGLTATKAALTKEIDTARSGFVLFKVNDVITTSVIESDSDRAKTEKRLKEVLAATDLIIKKAINGQKKQYVIMKDAELEEAIGFIQNISGQVIVRVVSASNVLYAEQVPVHFELFQNVLVFKKADKLGEAIINGARPLSEIEQSIKVLLAHVSDSATEKGILPDASGSVGNIAYSRIFEFSKDIKAQKKPVNVEVFAEKDTYTIGPLEINLRLVK